MARALQILRPDGRPATVEGETSLESACSIWQGVPIEIRALTGRGEIGPVHSAFPSIALCVTGHGHNDARVGRSTVRLPFRAGTLAISQSGFEVSRCEWQGSAEFIAIQIPPDTLSELMYAENEKLSLRTQMPTEDETLSALIMTMHEELKRDCSSGRLFAQGLSLALIGYLRSRYGDSTSFRTLGKLSQRNLSEVVAYVDANLGRDVGIGDLASLLSLSSSQFSRLFKTTVGLSPYQYLQKKRCERALELLKGPDSLAQIAQKVGLSNQSHFTVVFRQFLGVTPARARSEFMSQGKG